MPTDVFTILIILLVILLFAAALVIFRAMMYGRVPEPVETFELQNLDGRLVAEHLAEAIRHKTVSLSDTEQAGPEVFAGLHRALQKMYPRLHAALQRELVSESSLLYTWQGRNPELDPVLLCAHLDVVPYDPSTRDQWTHAPFSGDVADGYVWGRGALDMKSVLITIFEAVEGLIRADYQPERTLYLALGQDEEMGGARGARVIAALLAERGVRLEAVLDEGAAVTQGLVPGVDVPSALIGISEKGYATVELKVEGRPGHSSMPPPHTAVGVLARAVARVEENPMPIRLSMVRLMFAELGAFLPFSTRLALANPLLFEGALKKRITAFPQSAALARTTQAVTLIGGGIKDNVLPSEARAAVNCRLLPGDTREKLKEHIRKAVNDEAVQIHLDEDLSWEPSPVSSIDSPMYRSLTKAIRQVFPEAAVAPYLVVGATDSRHYTWLCPSVYRFMPQIIDKELLATIHGIDERISIENLTRMVSFYRLLIETWTRAAE